MYAAIPEPLTVLVPFDAPNGTFSYCPVCFPSIADAPQDRLARMLAGHVTSKDPEFLDFDFRENGVQLDHVSQYIPRAEYPGAILVEYETWLDGRFKLCSSCLSGYIMRIRYAPHVEKRPHERNS